MTKESKTNLGLVEWCKKYLGHPYWYGTFGQVGTETLLQQKAKQYPSHYGHSRMSKYRSQIGRQVFDCVGLIKGYIWDDNGKIKYNLNQDKSANGMLAACKEKGKINTIPDIPGVLVFMPGHVGVYIGNGEVIEARGFAYGVVKTKLSGRGWKNWGKCPYIDYVKKEKLNPKKEVEKPVGSVFKDVDDNRWSAPYIKAAKELGIIDGTGNGNFNPTGNLTREQSAVLMVRLYEKITGKKVVK